MSTFGANSLYLAPEYLGRVDYLSTAIVGIAIGVFIMSWNITTFILHSHHLKFLATTAQPFLKYCINNAAIPFAFLGFYFFKAFHYEKMNELISASQILILNLGFIVGFAIAVTFAFLYFFGADRTIYKTYAKTITNANYQYGLLHQYNDRVHAQSIIRVDWFLSASFKLRKPRNVQHYSQEFLESIFKRHHFSAVLAILIAFIFLVVLGFLADLPLFQIPAAASVTLLFAILIAVAGAFSLFLQSWSIPAVVLIIFSLNWMYENEWIDPRNKVYGLNYNNKNIRPIYSAENIKKIASVDSIKKDEAFYLNILKQWKQNQPAEKPIMYFITVSGGGTRSATFVMNVLQHLDEQMNGKLMPKTVLISGASGGMLGASFYRELYLKNQSNSKLRNNPKLVDQIAKDLLNPLFFALITRDLMSPVQKFSYQGYQYIKDRGYAFEKQLNINTEGVLDKQLKDYAALEANAKAPIMFFNSVITRDGRKLIVATHPARFLMYNKIGKNIVDVSNPDALDFTSFFKDLGSQNISILSALRMNATFPYALPNVWLPSDPVIDVMDAGLRDNYGQETAFRFLYTYRDWIKANTSKVVVIQIVDRKLGGWDNTASKPNFVQTFTKPFLLLQQNWFRFQDYYLTEQQSYVAEEFGDKFEKIVFQYEPSSIDMAASLSFHLTSAEKRDIQLAIQNQFNQQQLKKLLSIDAKVE